MRFVCCITKATDTHSGYISLSAFPWQKLLCKHALVSHVYVHSLSCFKNLKASSGIATGVKLERLASTSLYIYIYIYIYKIHTYFLSLYVPKNPNINPKMSVCSSSLAGIAGSNSAGDVDVLLLWLLCVVR